MEDIRRQELHCHNCDKYVQFDLDISLNGNHVLECPNCGHEHCRVVNDGEITDRRWDQRNGWGAGTAINVTAFSVTASTASTWDSSSSVSSFTYGLWMDTTATTGFNLS